MTTKNYL